MTEEEREQGRWQGQIETTQAALSKRVARLEAMFTAVVGGLASVGAKSMGIWPW